MTEKTRLRGQAELDRFVENLRADKKSDRTIKSYAWVIKDMLTRINKEPNEITPEDLEQCKRAYSEGHTKSGISTYVVTVKTFFKHLGIEEKVKNLTIPKRPIRIPVFLTQEETSRMLKEAKNDPKDYAILTTFLYTGLRLSELVNLNIHDIDFRENTITVRSGKGDKDRQIPMHPEVKEALIRYLNYRVENNVTDKEGSDAVFIGYKRSRIGGSSITPMVHDYAARAGIAKRISPHKLRHTALSHWYKATGDIRFVQKIAGHARLSTTEIYVHTNVDYLKEVMEKANFSYTKPRMQIPAYHPEVKKDGPTKDKHDIDYFG